MAAAKSKLSSHDGPKQNTVARKPGLPGRSSPSLALQGACCHRFRVHRHRARGTAQAGCGNGGQRNESPFVTPGFRFPGQKSTSGGSGISYPPPTLASAAAIAVIAARCAIGSFHHIREHTVCQGSHGLAFRQRNVGYRRGRQRTTKDAPDRAPEEVAGGSQRACRVDGIEASSRREQYT